jgi:hypothetical protein
MRSALLARSHERTAVGSLWKREGECMYVRNDHGERQKGVLVNKKRKGGGAVDRQYSNFFN